MKSCPNCNKENFKDRAYCYECGAKMDGSPEFDFESAAFRYGKHSSASIWVKGLRNIAIIGFWIALLGIAMFSFSTYNSLEWAVGPAAAAVSSLLILVLGGLLAFILTAVIMVFLDMARDVAVIRSKLEE